MRFALTTLLLLGLALPAHAQRIWEGVYTDGQAERGKVHYDEACARCHGPTLTGAERGPSIKGPDFLSNWEKDSVGGLFTLMRDTMPRGRLGTVSEVDMLDTLTYILQQNGFPPGTTELEKDLASLDEIWVAKKGAKSSGPPSFALVRVIGCLTERPNNRWALTSAADPLPTRDEIRPPADATSATGRPLGSQTLELVSVRSAFKPELHKGHRMEARGLLYRDGEYADINLTALDMVAPDCRN